MPLMAVLGLVACTTPWEEDTRGPLRRLVVTEEAPRSGTIEVAVRPLEDETSMQWVVRPVRPGGAERVSHVRSLERGRDVVFLAADEVDPTNPFARSGAAFVAPTTTLQWPISPADGPLDTSRYTLRAGIADASRAYVSGSAVVEVLFKTDADLTSGTLPVNLVLGQATAADPFVVTAVEQAVELWREVYRAVGIELDIERFDLESSSLGAPSQGDFEAYEAMSGSTRPGAVNLVILEEITDFGGALGFAGGIPGPVVPSNLSAVVVSSTLSAGTDGVFEPAEVVLLGETMAHEVGHYLGLFHPVEAAFDSWDAIDDTPQCLDERTCVVDLGENLMFPYPLCEAGSCVQQQRLTVDQSAVAHRYTGVQ
jgi:hypothetical protein